MKFDTSDKKPKLYNLIALTVIAVAVLAALNLKNAGQHIFETAAVGDAYFLLMLFMLLHALRGQIKYNPYSYNTIFYLGFSIFVLFILIENIIITVRIASQPSLYNLHSFVGMLAATSNNYLLLTFPLVLVFSAFLFFSNISLIRHERPRFANLLGIILSVMLTGGVVLLYLVNRYVSGSMLYVTIHDICTNIYSAVLLYFECMLIGAIISSFMVSRHEPEYNRDFIIILGCGIRKDGTPTPLLRGRIDRALEFARRQREATGKEAVFVTSGGQGPDEVISESECMKNYLLSKGVPEERIKEENKSTDTLENMRFSKQIIDEINPQGKVAFSTTRYHVFRSGVSARRVKMRAVGMGAKTAWYFWPNAWVREFIGLVSEHRLKQGLILGGLIVIYAVLSFTAYYEL